MERDTRRAVVEAGLVRVDDFAERLPSSVFVLTVPPEGDRPGGLEVWTTGRNERALAAFSLVSWLMSTCGTGQPWVEVPTSTLKTLCLKQGVQAVALDLPLPTGPRYPEIDNRDQAPLEPAEPEPELGEYVYMPSRPVRAGQGMVEVEMQQHRRKLVVPTYTSPEALEAGCGPHQAWVSVRIDDLPAVIEDLEADGALLNPELSEAARHQGPVRDWRTRSIGED